jgi:acyl-CoA reductase-like NAD-dependent aldehyde dehydrogenase
MGEALSHLLAGRPEVVLALELGGVNHALLCADADLDRAVPVLADGAWRLTGQRCTATRVVHVPAARCEELCARLAAERHHWLPNGNPGGPLGPLIDAAAAQHFAAVWATAPATWQVWGAPRERRLQPASSKAFCPPLLARADDNAHTLVRDEHFGPGLVVLPYSDEQQAIMRMRANPHRLSAAVWTADREHFLALAAQLPYGLVGHDRNTAGARSDLPFGGLGRSGNGRPAALAAGQIFADQCVVG